MSKNTRNIRVFILLATFSSLTERLAEPDPGLRMSKLSNHRLSRMSFKSSVLADFDFDNQGTSLYLFTEL